MGGAGRRRSLRLAASANPSVTPAPGETSKQARGHSAAQGKTVAPPPKKAKKAALTLSKSFEDSLWKKGYMLVAGVDEAGRGPLAGPVVAAACIVTADVDIPEIADSKTITTEASREKVFQELIAHPNVVYGIGIQSAQSIDEINILQATYRAMEAAVQNLPDPAPSAVLIDGNRRPPHISAEHVETIVKGDSKCFSIAAASIIAKVTRDRLMHEAHACWPEYGFATHKGYGTKAHMAAVRKHGPCDIHRLTFRPLPEIVDALKASLGHADMPAGASAGDTAADRAEAAQGAGASQ